MFLYLIIHLLANESIDEEIINLRKEIIEIKEEINDLTRSPGAPLRWENSPEEQELFKHDTETKPHTSKGMKILRPRGPVSYYFESNGQKKVLQTNFGFKKHRSYKYPVKIINKTSSI